MKPGELIPAVRQNLTFLVWISGITAGVTNLFSKPYFSVEQGMVHVSVNHYTTGRRYVNAILCHLLSQTMAA